MAKKLSKNGVKYTLIPVSEDFHKALAVYKKRNESNNQALGRMFAELMLFEFRKVPYGCYT